MAVAKLITCIATKRYGIEKKYWIGFTFIKIVFYLIFYGIMYNIQHRGCNKSFQIFNTKRVIIILIHLKRRPTVMIYIEKN